MIKAFTGIKDIKPYKWSAIGNGEAAFEDIYIGNYGTRFVVSFRRKDRSLFLVLANRYKLDEQEMQDFADTASSTARDGEIVSMPESPLTQHL